MKEYEWKSSILILQNFFMFDDSLKNSTAAHQHLEALILCVTELYEEQQHLRYSLEEATINSCNAKLKYKNYKHRSETDMVTAVQNAKERNKAMASSLQRLGNEKNIEKTKTEKKLHNMLTENIKLAKQKEDCQKATKELLDCMGGLMQATAERRIQINQTRIKILEAYERTMAICDDIERTGFESAECYQQFQKDFAVLTGEAEAWKEKIAAQDALVRKQKQVVEVLQLEVRSNQDRNDEVEKVLELHEGELALLKAKRVDFVKHIRNTKELAIQEQTALEFTAETYETEKIDNENLIETKTNEIKTVVNDIAEEKIVREQLIVDNEWLVTSATNRKNRLYTMQTETKMNKQDIRIAHNVLTDILGDMARRKEENTMLSENLFMVADSRDMMEKFFAKKLRLLRTDLISEKHLRHKADVECKMLDDFMQKYGEIDLGYPIDGDLTDNLEMEKGKLEIVIDKIETEEHNIVEETQEEIVRFEKQEADYKLEIQIVEEKVEAAAAITHNLTETKENHEKRIEYLSERKINIEKEFVDLIREDLHWQKEGIKMKENKVVLGEQVEVIQEETEVLKDELESVYFQLREQPPRMKKELKQINKEVYRLMKQLDKLLRANHKLEVCGKEKMKSCAAEEEEIQRISDSMIDDANILLSIKTLFSALSSKKKVLSSEANYFFLSALKTVGGIKACSEVRLGQVSETARHFEELIESCITIMEPSRRIGSDTQLKKMEELKIKRQEYKKRQTFS